VRISTSMNLKALTIQASSGISRFDVHLRAILCVEYSEGYCFFPCKSKLLNAKMSRCFNFLKQHSILISIFNPILRKGRTP
ncbi:hypothetical protein, partial [Domibacillus tundrae]|uniref:hypothetical protein n=1 Tax=Domibacillus tundrae TaxID=1587527 RepID=UPI0033930509